MQGGGACISETILATPESGQRARSVQKVLVVLVRPNLHFQIQVHVLVLHAGGLLRQEIPHLWSVRREEGRKCP